MTALAFMRADGVENLGSIANAQALPGLPSGYPRVFLGLPLGGSFSLGLVPAAFRV